MIKNRDYDDYLNKFQLSSSEVSALITYLTELASIGINSITENKYALVYFCQIYLYPLAINFQ